MERACYHVTVARFDTRLRGLSSLSQSRGVDRSIHKQACLFSLAADVTSQRHDFIPLSLKANANNLSVDLSFRQTF